MPGRPRIPHIWKSFGLNKMNPDTPALLELPDGLGNIDDREMGRIVQFRSLATILDTGKSVPDSHALRDSSFSSLIGIRNQYTCFLGIFPLFQPPMVSISLKARGLSHRHPSGDKIRSRICKPLFPCSFILRKHAQTGSDFHFSEGERQELINEAFGPAFSPPLRMITFRIIVVIIVVIIISA